jgi:NADH-quinone oxidoreductase subunit M
LLACLLLLPWAAAIVPVFGRSIVARGLTLATMLIAFGAALALFTAFDGTADPSRFGVDVPWIRILNVDLRFAVDGLNVYFMLLTALLFPVVLVCAWRTDEGSRPLYLSLMLLLEALLLATFLAQDLLVLFVTWEAVLVPMVLLILAFGGPRRRRAALTFFLYTMAGGVLLLAAVLWLGATSLAQTGQWAFDFATLQSLRLSETQQGYLFVAIALACAIKSPLVPFHSWLPLAYGEASPSGTALMAGVMSKMGAYGFLKVALPLCPLAAYRLAPAIAAFAAISIVYGAVLALRQRHYKQLVACASLSHMGYVVLGVFSFQATGLHGAMFQVLSHGVVVAGLLLMLGLLEQRYGAAWPEVHGLATRAPRFAVVLMLFVLASLALPLSSGFTAEFMVLIGAFVAGLSTWQAGTGATMLISALAASAGVVLGATYMLRFARATVFDDSGRPGAQAKDLGARELAALAPLLLVILWVGVKPSSWMDKVEPALAQLARPAVVALGARHGE